MTVGRFYDPPFVLKIVLLVCIVLIGLAHRKGWMSRTVGDRTEQNATLTTQAPYELKPGK
jgi:hypothetical protein